MASRDPLVLTVRAQQPAAGVPLFRLRVPRAAGDRSSIDAEGFDSFGQTHTYRGTAAGNSWTWTYETRVGDQPWKVRIAIREVSPTLQTYRSDISRDGKTWTNVLDGTLRKSTSKEFPLPGVPPVS